MARFDARIKTELSALVTPYKGETEKVANVVELSLSGLLIDGWLTETPGTLHLRLPLKKDDDVCLNGEIVRIKDAKSAIKFYMPERETTETLWEFIRERISCHDICPYCNHSIKSGPDYCERCGWYLNFSDSNYLDKHLAETFLHRISNRAYDLNAEQRRQVLRFIDSDLLAKKDLSAVEYFVGASEQMLEVFSMIRKVAATENSVLIFGESGTGKKLTAKTIHDLSRRKDKPFVVTNCCGISEQLLDSELFGYEKEAVKGALMSEKGKLESASGGTLFLDEIVEMPLPLQAKFLRVLEEGIMERLSGRKGIQVDIRVIASSDRSLEPEIEKGRFRLDLYHRINTFTLTLPSLRNRGEEIMILAKHFLNKFCLAKGIEKRFSKKAVEAINAHFWPGNVRELINKIEKAIVVSDGDTITAADLSLEVQNMGTIRSLRETRASIEKQKLIEVLNVASHNIAKTAMLLGVSRPTIYSLMKKYGIVPTKDN